MSAAPERKLAPQPRRRRWRVYLAVTICAILACGAGYVSWRIYRSGPLPAAQVLDANLALAQMSATVIDTHCASIQSALLVLARVAVLFPGGMAPEPKHTPDELAPAPAPAVEQTARQLFESTSASTVDIYNAEGGVLASYGKRPRGVPPRAAGDVLSVHRRVEASGRGVFLETRDAASRLIIVAVMRDGGSQQTIAIASYPTKVVEEWLSPMWKASGRDIYIADSEKRIIATSNKALAPGASLAGHTLTSAALVRAGKSEDVAPASRKRALIGYAPASVPGWAILAASTRRNRSEDDTSDYFVLIEAILIAIGLGIGAAWVWERRVRHRQPDIPIRTLPPPRTAAAYNPTPPPQRPGGRKPFAPTPQTSAPRPEPPLEAVPPRGSKPEAAGPEPPPLTNVSAEQGAWRCVGVSVRGTSHKKTGKPCQDAAFCKIVNTNLLLGAVADGAGSAPFGDQGAQLAARLAVETLASHAGGLTASSGDEQWNRLMLSAMGVARSHVEAGAAVRNEPARQLATTLILFAAAPELLVTAQIGDGAVVFRDSSGNIRALTRPSHGEYINTTTFLVSPDAFKTVQQEIWRGPYSNIAAFTDGLQMLALTMQDGQPHVPFFTPLFDFVAKSADTAHALSELGAFLQSDKITERADDDLTLMLAVLK